MTDSIAIQAHDQAYAHGIAVGILFGAVVGGLIVLGVISFLIVSRDELPRKDLHREDREQLRAQLPPIYPDEA